MSLIVPGAANIVTAAGDVAIIVTDASGNSRCIHYQRATGMPLQYAEGTWTPAVSFAGGASGLTYTSRDGGYIMVGNLLHVWGTVVINAKGSSSGQLRIGGLPFSMGGSLGTRGAGAVSKLTNGVSLPTGLAIALSSGSNYGVVTGVTATGTTDVTNANVSNGTEINFSATYSRV